LISKFDLKEAIRKMILSIARMVIAILAVASSAQAQTGYIAGYYAGENVDTYLEGDKVQKDLEDILGDKGNVVTACNPDPLTPDKGSCCALGKAKDWWDSSLVTEGQYLRNMPTYPLPRSDEWNEFTAYYGCPNFHIEWVNQAFAQGLAPTGPIANVGLAPQCGTNGKADFYHAFINQDADEQGVWFTPPSNCVGFEESIKKATSFVFQFGEIMQLLQKAYDEVGGNCIAQSVSLPCFNAVAAWDAAVAVFVGSLEANGADNSSGNPAGKTLWSLAEKRCGNYFTCGVDTNSNQKGDIASVNYKIMSLFAAGRQHTFQGQASEMKQIMRLISNKLALGSIQGTMRYAWRLSGPPGSNTLPTLTPPTPGFDLGAPPDKETAEMGVFAMGVLPKVWACSKKAEAKLFQEIQIGGLKTKTPSPYLSTQRPTVNFDNVKLALECNYKCLGITCEEVGSLIDGQTDAVDADGNQIGTLLARSVTCNDGKMGTTANNVGCKRQRGTEKKACKKFKKKPGIVGRDTLQFFHNAVVV